MKKIMILSILGLLFLAYSTNAQKNKYVKTDSYEGVIFSKYCWPTSEIAWHPYFPTDQEIAKMEKKISYSIRIILLAYEKEENFNGICDIAKDIQKFKRQYYGYWIGKEKIILVYFYKYPPKGWKEKISPISGNGQCSEFKLEYSINSDKLHNFFADLSPE
jgi:hypothetical protein